MKDLELQRTVVSALREAEAGALAAVGLRGSEASKASFRASQATRVARWGRIVSSKPTTSLLITPDEEQVAQQLTGRDRSGRIGKPGPRRTRGPVTSLVPVPQGGLSAARTSEHEL